MSRRNPKRSTDLFRELRGKLGVLQAEIDGDSHMEQFVLSTLGEIDALAAELEARALEQAAKRRLAAERYGKKHPGKRARW